MYRVEVVASDGKKCGVSIRVYHKSFYKSNLKQVANALRVELGLLDHVFDNWTPADLKQHLSQFPSPVLDSNADLCLFREHLRANAPVEGTSE